MLKFCYFLGGFDGEKGFKSTEIIYQNGSKTEGPKELPEPIASHCMVEYAGIIILMGGWAVYVTPLWLRLNYYTLLFRKIDHILKFIHFCGLLRIHQFFRHFRDFM